VGCKPSSFLLGSQPSSPLVLAIHLSSLLVYQLVQDLLVHGHQHGWRGHHSDGHHVHVNRHGRHVRVHRHKHMGIRE